MANSTSPPRVMVNFAGRHHPVHAVANGGLWVLIAAVVAALLHLPILIITVGAVLLAVVTVGVARHEELAAGVVAYRGFACLLAGGWSDWAIAVGGRSWRVVEGAVFAFALAGMIIASRRFAAARKRDAAAAEAAAAATLAADQIEQERRLNEADPSRPLALEWVDRMNRIMTVLKGALTIDDVLGVEAWPGENTGDTIEVQLPAGGVGVDQLERYADDLATDAGFDRGSGVELTEGINRRRMLVRISKRDAIGAEPILYGKDYPQRSISTHPIDFLVFKDGTTPDLIVRQKSIMVTGDQGSGKTTATEAAIAWHLECVDVVNLAIDYNGGGVAIPTLMGWRNNRDKVTRPPFWAVGDTPESAALICSWLYAVLTDRKKSAGWLKAAENVKLLPLGPNLPFFRLFVDEFALLNTLAMKDPSGPAGIVWALIEQINELGRDAGCMIWYTSLASTSDKVGSRSMSALVDVRFAMKADPAEMGYSTGNHRLDPRALTAPGMGYLTYDKRPERIARAKLLTPDDMTELLTATDDRRCAPDERALQIGGDMFRNWWTNKHGAALLDVVDDQVEKMRAHRRGEDVDTSLGTPPATDTEQDGPAMTDTSHIQQPDALGTMDGAQQDMQTALERARQEADRVEAEAAGAEPATDDTADVDRRFDEIVAGWNNTAPDPAPGQNKADTDAADQADARAAERILGALAEAGQNTDPSNRGIMPGELATTTGVSDAHLYRVLARLKKTGAVVQPVPRGPYFLARFAPGDEREG